ncbi:MAG TPA: ABC transporter permease, partial [Candidatus Kapabacteria bacterium]|nr:ABC transporter permease [Candidatus Kapabacteria bacterium]
MLKNYLKVAFRTLGKQKSTSFINIACLTIGISVCLFLLLWVQDELSYDRFHENANRIYRVPSQVEVNNQIKRGASTAAPLAPALIAEFPWIQKIMRLDSYKLTIKLQDKCLREEIFFSDPEIFDIFTFPIVAGDRRTALKEPHTILISENIKNKYFAGENPLGKTIKFPDLNRDYTIAGVFKDIPRNSHIRFDFLSSLYIPKAGSPNWGAQNYYTYILVNEDAPLDTFNEKMPSFVDKYLGKQLRERYKFSYLLQPLTKIHLVSTPLVNDIAATADVRTVYIISAIAFFILFIACLNYIHLATAKFSKRSKEAALRKVLGASNRKLVYQFLSESFLHTFAALILSLFIVEAFLPLFNSFSGKILSLAAFTNGSLIIVMFGMIVSVGLFSGIVPALVMMKYKPAPTLKGVYQNNPLIAGLRKFLVVFQFAVALIFFICTLVISDQLVYMRTKNIGLTKENVINIAIHKNEETIKKYKTIKHEFLQDPGVIAVGASAFTPGQATWNNNYWVEGMPLNDYSSIDCLPVDYDFLDTFQVKVAAGRGFSEKFPTDAENAFIVNKAAEKAFGYGPVLGKQFSVSGGWRKGTIIGVVDDFHYNSLHRDVKPLALYIHP